MKHYYLSIFLATLMSMAYTMASAHDIAVANSDGKTIYYVKNSDGSSVSVTYLGSSSISYSNEYTGDIVIPETVTYSGQTYSVTSIGSTAFYDCDGLTSVTIPNSVTSIGTSAFSDCSGLTSVTIPNSVTSIGEWAFSYSGLTSVTIPNSVTSIGSFTFSGCIGLTSVTIPNSVTSIGYSAFSGCSGMAEIKVANGNSVYDSRNDCNAIIETSTNTLIVGCKNTIIPNSVTSIGDGAFSSCSASVTIPNSVTSIGDGAFSSCSGLTSVTIPNSVTSIGEWAFSYSGLTSVTIPNSVASISSNAFKGCLGLTSVTIPNSVTSIGESAFSYCYGLKSVTIPNSVTCIDENAFQDCLNLTSINSEIKNPFILGANAFSDISNQCVLTVPVGKRDAYIAKGWTTDVFQGGIVEETNLYCGYCGDGVIYTYDETTKTLTIEGNNAMADYSDPSLCPWYSYRGDIQTLVIKDGVTSIGAGAFCGCSGLTSVTIPNSVTSIGSAAFSGCSGLTSVIIPSSVTSIDVGAFSSCSGLTSVTIPNSVTSIGSWAFRDCSSLTYVTIGNSVTCIDENAFLGCSNLTSINSEIKNPFILGANAFSGISKQCVLIVPVGKRDAYIAKGWTTYVFQGGIVEETNFYCGDCGDGVIYTYDKTTKTLTIEGNNAMEDYSGPTLCPWYSYRGDIQSLVIKDGVTCIGSFAFYGCSSLTSVTIPNSVTSIGRYAFSGTAWYENHPDGLVYAGNIAYKYKGPIPANTSITLKEGTLGIASFAFFNCSGLTSVTIPNSVTSIGFGAFYGCSGLTSVTIPNSVTSIGESAFGECGGLTSVTIPNSVTSIGDYAFNGCSCLTSVKVMRKEPPTIGHDNFSNVSHVYVPYGSKAKYEAAQYWKDFNIRMLSDSNGDDVLNAKDYSGVASYIMGETPEACDVEACDVDGNGTVDVRDYVGIANIITTGSIYGGTSNNAKAAMSKGAAMPATDESDADNVIYVENVSGSKNSQVELSIRMRNASDIRGFQFDLYLPEGVTMANNAKASLSSDRLAAGDAHTLMVNEVSDGAVRFLCNSMNDESFAGGDGEIATLTVNIADNVANGVYDVVVKNALMTETDISRSYEADDIKSTLTVLDQTGVETVTADDERRDGSIYTVDGQLVGKKSTTSQLREGIYIRNGKKIVVK